MKTTLHRKAKAFTIEFDALCRVGHFDVGVHGQHGQILGARRRIVSILSLLAQSMPETGHEPNFRGF
jgi:hypothetical protein